MALAAVPALASAAPEDDARATVIIYNEADPSSRSLAEFYADRRKIPVENLVGLNCPLTEEISRLEYETSIAGVLDRTFVEKGWWTKSVSGTPRVISTKIRFVALMRGMPLKIRAESSIVSRADLPPEIGRHNEASVDADLACLGMPATSASGPIVNPFFRRFTPIGDSGIDPGLLLVCRLDGPTEGTVRAMIDNALNAERDGLWGWAYVDTRNIRSGGYAEGDEWLRNVASKMRSKGIPVIMDDGPETLPVGFPITDAAVYYGWYSETIDGPFASPDFRFRPGAIAVHIHSFSASTLRSSVQNWAGPLVMRGASITLGNVYEPYLGLTIHLDIFQDRLMAGLTFAESIYSAANVLSWMTVAVGDPLYRPYAVWNDMFADKPKELSSWQEYREIILSHGGDVLAAAQDLEVAAKKSGRSMFLESLWQVQYAAGDWNAAMATVTSALQIEKDPDVRFRLLIEKIGTLRTLGDIKGAGELLAEESGAATNDNERALLKRLHDEMFPPSPPDAKPADVR